MMAEEPKNRYETLKKDFERILAAPAADREALTREFAHDLRRRDPETAANIQRWARDGLFLWTSVEFARKSAFARDGLTESEKSEIFDDVMTVGATLATIQKSNELTNGLIPTDIAIEFAWSAFWIGLRAGLKPAEIKRLREEWFRARQRASAGGRVRQRREASLGWKAHAKDISKRVRDENPEASQEKVAEKILETWQAADVDPPGFRTLVRYVAQLEKRDEIPPRAGSRQK